MPLIIIEGPDGSGKTTLVENLENSIKTEGLTVRICHLGPPKYDPDLGTTPGEQEYINLLTLLVDACETWTEDFVIFDRFHMGCPVYTPLYRADKNLHEGYGELTYEQYTTVDRAIADTGGRTYVLAPPAQLLFDRITGRGDDFLDLRDPVQLLRQLNGFTKTYQRLSEWSESAELIPYSTNDEELAAQVHYILAGSTLRDVDIERGNT